MRRCGEVEKDFSRVNGYLFLRQGAWGQRCPWPLKVQAQSRGKECSWICRTVQILISIQRRMCFRRVNLLGNRIRRRREDGRKFLDQVWAIAGFLKLLNDGDHNVIADSLGVDLRGP